MRAETNSTDRAELTGKIDSLAARVEGLRSQARQAAGASMSGRETALPADFSGYDLNDQISYLKSALNQRSAEADEWMSSDRAARDLLAESRAALERIEAELLRERGARERAEENVERLTQELEDLTRLLIEVEEREARKIADGKAEAIQELSEEHALQVSELEARIRRLVAEAREWSEARDGVERSLADERARTDQYRDVAERMQALCTYQSRELALLRDRLGEQESRSEGQTRDFNKLLAEYRKMRQTMSWKATAPIRKFFKALRKLFKGQPRPASS